MAPALGFEPRTKWLTATYSTAELCRNVQYRIIYAPFAKLQAGFRFFCIFFAARRFFACKKAKRVYIIRTGKPIGPFGSFPVVRSRRRGGMADALGSGPSSFTGVGVQLPPSAPS